MNKQTHCGDEAYRHLLPIAVAFWSIQIISVEECSSLTPKFDADLLLYSLSNFECDGHTVYMLTQCHPPPPVTSTVKSSLFMHVHSSPLSLAARLHQCHANCSCYITMVGLSPDRPNIFYFVEPTKASFYFRTTKTKFWDVIIWLQLISTVEIHKEKLVFIVIIAYLQYVIWLIMCKIEN